MLSVLKMGTMSPSVGRLYYVFSVKTVICVSCGTVRGFFLVCFCFLTFHPLHFFLYKFDSVLQDFFWFCCHFFFCEGMNCMNKFIHIHFQLNSFVHSVLNKCLNTEQVLLCFPLKCD